MIQPSVYSRQQIVDAAFELIREEGWPAVSTRAIAKKIGSSTMPIYSHVRSVDELKKELTFRAKERQIEFQTKSYTEESLLNAAFGYVVFARDEKMLFRFLYLETQAQLDLEKKEEMKDTFIADLGGIQEIAAELAELNEAGHSTLVTYSWIFTHGLAMLVNAGGDQELSDQAILDYLKNAGAAFYLWSNRKGDLKNDDQ